MASKSAADLASGPVFAACFDGLGVDDALADEGGGEASGGASWLPACFRRIQAPATPRTATTQGTIHVRSRRVQGGVGSLVRLGGGGWSSRSDSSRLLTAGVAFEGGRRLRSWSGLPLRLTFLCMAAATRTVLHMSSFVDAQRIFAFTWTPLVCPVSLSPVLHAEERHERRASCRPHRDSR